MSDRVRQWGEPLWRSRRLSGGPRRPLRPIDVAVVGGGLTGMSAALHLARSGLRTAVLEAGTVGEGASGRTGGIVLEGTATGIRQGADTCVPSLARLVAALELDCDLHLPGCWEIEHQWGSGSAALPWRDDDVPIRIARTVAGGSVEPRALLFGLANAALDAGAIIREHSPVKRVIVARAALELDDTILSAANVVVALNAWTPALISGLPPMHSALTYACATEPLDQPTLLQIGLGERMPFYTIDRPYLWGRVASKGEVVFGAGLSYAEPTELERIRIGAKQPKAILANLERRVRGLHPALNSVQIPSRWAGPIAFTDDAIPVLGRHPSNPAVLVAGAYAGHGVAFSVHAGESMARAILEDAPLPEWGALEKHADRIEDQ